MSYDWLYVLNSLLFMTSPFLLRFLKDNIGIITRSLFVHTYFWRFNIYYHRMWQYDSVSFHIYRLSNQWFPKAPTLVRIYEFLFYYKTIYYDIDIMVYTFIYNMLSIFYHLLSHIYHAVWLIIILKYIVLYLVLLVFWFQNSDLISEIYSYLKIIYEKESLVHWPSVILEMSVIFCNYKHVGQTTTIHLIFCYFSCVCLYIHFDEDVNEIFVCSKVGFSV